MTAEQLGQKAAAPGGITDPHDVHGSPPFHGGLTFREALVVAALTGSAAVGYSQVLVREDVACLVGAAIAIADETLKQLAEGA
jgi:hypothetical protein